jgi:GntR family transcriptional regulator, transcriptional repressor for pyruvate dehydrogenase complex
MKLSDVVLARSRVSDQIKDALKQSILSGEFKSGDKLPREDEVAAMFKVSKVSVREALRDLEGEGLIQKRRGTFGGNFVAQPGSNELDLLVSNYCQFGTITADELLDFAQMLEPALVSAAARRRTQEDLEKMRANIKESEQCFRDGKVGTRLILDFHRLLVESCHNRFCSVVHETLMSVSVKLLRPSNVTLEDFETHLRYSKELYKCILRRDENASQSIMISIFQKFIEISDRNSKE